MESAEVSARRTITQVKIQEDKTENDWKHLWIPQHGFGWNAPIFCTSGYERFGWVTGNGSSGSLC